MNKFLRNIVKMQLLFLVLLIWSCEESPTSIQQSDYDDLQVEMQSNSEANLFTITKDENNDKLFYFQVTGTSNLENKNDLQYRWDFDGDNLWDTEWMSQKGVNFNYENYENYSPKLIVKNENNTAVEVFDQVAVMPWCVDVDGNSYKIIKIGTQWWMAENLKVKHFRNKESIKEITDKNEWRKLNTAAYCYYNNDRNTPREYGLLYNWRAAIDKRGIAPAGWHVPTDSEYQTLIDYLGGDLVAGGKMKEKGNMHWCYPNKASNSSGFTFLPGGYRASNGDFHGVPGFGFLWMASSSDKPNEGYLYMDHLYYEIVKSYCNKRFGFSIRCIRDEN